MYLFKKYMSIVINLLTFFNSRSISLPPYSYSFKVRPSGNQPIKTLETDSVKTPIRFSLEKERVGLRSRCGCE